jgi:hypothetical protein
MIKYLLLFFIFFQSLVLKGQKTEFKKSGVINTVQLTKDKIQVNSLLIVAASYRKNDPSKAIDYANSAIKISEKIVFKEGLINANIEKKKKYLNHFLQPNLYKN